MDRCPPSNMEHPPQSTSPAVSLTSDDHLRSVEVQRARSERIEFAISDADLFQRLTTSAWLTGRPWKMPSWLKTLPEVDGDPALMSEERLRYLLAGGVPVIDIERRYIRNKATVKQIAAELVRPAALVAQTTKSPQVRPSLSNDVTLASTNSRHPRSSEETTTSGDRHGVNPAKQRPTPPPSQATAFKFNFSKPSSNGIAQASAPPSQSQNDQEQAMALRRTVLAPLYQRIEHDGLEITRLRQEKADLAAEIGRHQEELNTLQATLQRNRSDDAPAPDSSLRSAKRAFSPSRSMANGTATNDGDGQTTHDQLTQLAVMITRELDKTTASETIHLCGLAPLKLMSSEPDQVLELAQQKLHTFPYQHVPTCWRRLYEDASLSKASEMLFSQAEAERTGSAAKKRKLSADPRVRARARDIPTTTREWINELVGVLDQGLTVSGAPGRRAVFEAIFEELATLIEIDLTEDLPRHFGVSRPSPLRTDRPIDRSRRALHHEEFQQHLIQSATPIIVEGALLHWPALHKWQDPNYFVQNTLGGKRLVPIEVGRLYTDENWGQRIVTMGEYIKTYLIPKDPPQIGYLAQHDLFTQIPALLDDITTPDYCYTTPPAADEATRATAGLETAPQLSDPILNAWIGPKGTRTPLHTDPYHNILCQVVGHKYVRLYSPEQTPHLYPRGTGDNGVSMNNTSEVDMSHVHSRSVGGSADLDAIRDMEKRYPNFLQAPYIEGILGPGECLYVPVGWWHYVESLSVSCSVSFWWN